MIASEFEKASVECIAACEITARLFPEFDFTDQILTRIGIRRKDIVSDLAIAAAMVNPSYLYCPEDQKKIHTLIKFRPMMAIMGMVMV